MKNIVINWINNSSVKNLESLKDIKAIYLFYNDSDLLPFTIMQALMGYEVKYISYQGEKDKFLENCFLDIFGRFKEQGELSESDELIIVTEDVLQMKLPEQVQIVKSLDSLKKHTLAKRGTNDPFSEIPPINIGFPENRILWLIKDWIKENKSTSNNLAKKLGVEKALLTACRNGDKIDTDLYESFEEFFGLKSGELMQLTKIVEYINGIKSKAHLSNKALSELCGVEVSKINAFLRGKCMLTDEEWKNIQSIGNDPVIEVPEKSFMNPPETGDKQDSSKDDPAADTETMTEDEKNMYDKIKDMF